MSSKLNAFLAASMAVASLSCNPGSETGLGFEAGRGSSNDTSYDPDLPDDDTGPSTDEEMIFTTAEECNVLIDDLLTNEPVSKIYAMVEEPLRWSTEEDWVLLGGPYSLMGDGQKIIAGTSVAACMYDVYCSRVNHDSASCDEYEYLPMDTFAKKTSDNSVTVEADFIVAPREWDMLQNWLFIPCESDACKPFIIPFDHDGRNSIADQAYIDEDGNLIEL